MSMPPSQGDAPGWPACRNCWPLVSATIGSRRSTWRIRIRAPQSKLWIVTWSSRPARAHLAGDDLHELLARCGLFGSAGLDLGLDVEGHASGAVGVDEGEDLRQQSACARRATAAARGRRGRERAAVDGPHLGERQVLDEPLAGHVGELRVAGERGRGVEALGGRRVAVVRDDRVAVLGDLHVELQRAHAQLQGVGERREGVLHDEGDAAAVGLEVEALAVPAPAGGGRADRRGPRPEARAATAARAAASTAARARVDRWFPMAGSFATPTNGHVAPARPRGDRGANPRRGAKG